MEAILPTAVAEEEEVRRGRAALVGRAAPTLETGQAAEVARAGEALPWAVMVIVALAHQEAGEMGPEVQVGVLEELLAVAIMEAMEPPEAQAVAEEESMATAETVVQGLQGGSGTAQHALLPD